MCFGKKKKRVNRQRIRRQAEADAQRRWQQALQSISQMQNQARAAQASTPGPKREEFTPAPYQTGATESTGAPKLQQRKSRKRRRAKDFRIQLGSGGTNQGGSATGKLNVGG